MNRLIKAIVTLFAALLLSLGMGVAAFAAPSTTYVISDPVQNNAEVEALALSLERKYGITILYPTMTGENSVQLATIYPEMLRTLDHALSLATPQLVRTVSEYYYNLNGRRLTYVYTNSDLRGPYGFEGSPDVQVGGFTRSISKIELFIPEQEGQAIDTGDNPLTILHEFGHALHFMLIDTYGYAGMERLWLELMDPYSFEPEQVDPNVFVTPYASTDYEEDFSETFAHALVFNRPGLGLSHRLSERQGDVEVSTHLGKKMEHIEMLLRIIQPDNLELRDNYRKVYDTPVATVAAGLRLSGHHLLFIGMEEPRTISLMLLNNLNVRERDAVWFSSLGGWYCRDLGGNHLVLFPGGTYGNPGKDLMGYKAELDAKAAEDRAEAEALAQEAAKAREAAKAQAA